MKKLRAILIYVILFVVALGMIFPMFWMIILSLKEYPESYKNYVDLLFSAFTFKNYSETLNSDSFGLYFFNSFLVAGIVTIGNLIFCTLAAYAFSRSKLRFKNLLFGTVLAILIIPPQVVMIPLYRMMVELGWINTYFALTVPWLVTPFGIFLLKQYIDKIPVEIEDAARIDGAGYWYVIFRIIFPLSKPILTVLAIYTFLGNWNTFLFPFLFTNNPAYRTLPVGLTFYLGKQSIDWGHLMAGAAISALPVIIIFLFFQHQIIKGLTAGALKE